MNMNFPLQVNADANALVLYLHTTHIKMRRDSNFLSICQDSMRGMNPSTLQSMFQANHMGKASLYDNQGGKMKKKQPMMLHPDPSILGK